jgi:hypothetical protein
MSMPRHHRIGAIIVAVGLSLTSARAQAPASIPISVFKSATCGCCAKWNDHMRASGFAVMSSDLPDVNVPKDQHGVPVALRSCHTALVGGYIVEGHVPADVVKKLLRERPPILGIAVPGMPMGSPGMEGDRKDTYQVLTFDKRGNTTVYATR